MSKPETGIPGSNFSEQLKRKNLIFKADNSLKTLTGDKDLIFRALVNIISNAVRHAEKGGTVELFFHKANDKNIIKIFNSGDIISKEDGKRAFDRLYRGEFARNTSGSGLGLTISKKIVQLHGGGISIYPDENSGTIVVITIPE